MYNCCATACPDCVNFGSSSSEGSLLASTSAHLAAHLFDFRGGHISASTVESAADVVLTAAAVTAVTPYNLPLNLWKVIFQFFLTLLNVACWLIPLQSNKISENKFGLSMANAFSAGVFLSLAFGHLIPECVHGFEGYNEALPFMIVLSGYLLIFFVEKVAFSDAHDMFHAHEGASSSPSKEVDEGHSKVVGKSAVILLGALAVHSILEMTALGLADTFGDSALLSLSIALHQVRVLRALGP
jgi:zinc transporter ZupT